MSNSYFRLLFLFLFFFNSNLIAKAYEHEIPNDLKIVFTASDYKRYQNLIKSIDDYHYWNLVSDHKIKLSIFGSYEYKGKTINFSGSARVSGDLKDHIKTGLVNFSSLSISLNQGNVGGVVNFRLLIPETKQGQNEILWATLMEEIGYPTLLRKYIKVNLMGVDRIFIFEEKPEKEFLESNAIREGPIVEFDEQEFWENNILDEKKPLHIKDNWPNYLQLHIKNSDFLKNLISNEIAYRSLYFGFQRDGPHYIKHKIHKENKLVSKFEELNYKYAEHGMAWTNRKFIYDVIYNDYIPIYFDGNVGWSRQNFCNGIDFDSFSSSIKTRIKVVKSKFLDRSFNGEFSDNHKCLTGIVLEKFDGFDVKLKKINPLTKKSYGIKQILANKQKNNKEINHPIYKYIPEKNHLELCSTNFNRILDTSCKIINPKKIKNIMAGNIKPIIKNDYAFYPILEIEYTPKINEKFDEYNIVNEDLIINIDDEYRYIKINAANSRIKLYLNNINSNVVFYDSKFNNSNIEIISKELYKNNNQIRYNQKLLTSCLTLIDSEIYNSIFKSSGCSKEDAINFIRSKGNNINLDINDALYDALDVDFSDISFNKININNAGNDCIDFSSGVYNINKIYLSNCGDKAVSIGEKSLASFQNVSMVNANIGIASKDLSEVYINKITKADNIKNCLMAYQKKQEYGPGYIFYKNNNKNCNFSTTNIGFLKTNKSCKYVSRNYFFNSCVIDRRIEISLKNDLRGYFDFYVLNSINNNLYIFDTDKKLNTQNCFSNCTISIDLPNSINTFEYGLIDKDNKNKILSNSYF